MTTERLDVRLDPERRRKLRQLAQEQGTPVSGMIRKLIDKAYDETLLARRVRAAEELGKFEIDDVPDPEILCQQLEGTYEPGGLH